MKVLVLPKYSRRAASYRYRFEQYLPYLEANGVECEVSPLFDDAYLDERMKTGRLGASHVARALLRRTAAAAMAGRYDLVWLHTEAFPYAPAVVESFWRSFAIPYVLDFDDALFHQYDAHRSRAVRAILGNKIRTAIAGAQRVFAGSEYLAEYARRSNRFVDVIPTSVDLDVYAPSPDRLSRPGFTVGWIGSPSTAWYLKLVDEALSRFAQGRRDVRLVAVGSGPLGDCRAPWEVRPWSESSEVAEIREFDVGIMPLDDSPWSRGKCGFKLIQCMACEVPVIASPIGANAEIVEDGKNGFWASEPAAWLSALERAYENKKSLRTMGQAGRAAVAEKYSAQAQRPRILEGLIQVATAARERRARAHQ